MVYFILNSYFSLPKIGIYFSTPTEALLNSEKKKKSSIGHSTQFIIRTGNMLQGG
jgi:hypothetical protein